MNLKPATGQLRHDFQGEAANEEWPLHEKVLLLHELEFQYEPRQVNGILSDLYRQINLQTALDQQSLRHQQAVKAGEDTDLRLSQIGVGCNYTLASWFEIINSYITDLHDHQPQTYQDIYCGVMDQAIAAGKSEIEDTDLLLGFSRHYKDRMSTLNTLAADMQTRLPQLQVTTDMTISQNESGETVIGPTLVFKSAQGTDIRRVLGNFLNRRMIQPVPKPAST